MYGSKRQRARRALMWAALALLTGSYAWSVVVTFWLILGGVTA